MNLLCATPDEQKQNKLVVSNDQHLHSTISMCMFKCTFQLRSDVKGVRAPISAAISPFMIPPYPPYPPNHEYMSIGLMHDDAVCSNSPPSLVYANYSQPSATFMQFSPGYSFHPCCFGNSFMIKFVSLHFETEAWW